MKQNGNNETNLDKFIYMKIENKVPNCTVMCIVTQDE